MKQKIRPITTGDHVANVKAIRSGSCRLYCIVARLRVPECAKTFQITYNPKLGKLTIHCAGRLAQIVGEERYEAIEDALLQFFGGFAATLKH